MDYSLTSQSCQDISGLRRAVPSIFKIHLIAWSELGINDLAGQLWEAVSPPSMPLREAEWSQSHAPTGACTCAMDNIKKGKTLRGIKIFLSNRSNWIPGIVFTFFFRLFRLFICVCCKQGQVYDRVSQRLWSSNISFSCFMPTSITCGIRIWQNITWCASKEDCAVSCLWFSHLYWGSCMLQVTVYTRSWLCFKDPIFTLPLFFYTIFLHKAEAEG